MTNSSPIRVITLADEHYAMPLAVMGRSLLENHRAGRELMLTIIDGGITESSRQRVESSWASAATGATRWEWVKPQYGNAARLPVYGRVPALTYARLFLDVYCGLAERAVLLDSDTLVLADVAELHDSDLGEGVLGACLDPFIRRVDAVDGLPASARAQIPPETPYFNAGVLVADLTRWRQQRVGERCLAYIDRHFEELRQYDQDSLNAELAGSWKQLAPEWNTQPRTPHALGIPLPAHPRIVHFSGRLKPWLYDGGTAVDRLFFEYADRTDWKGLRPPRDWQALVWKLYDSPLRRLLHAVECRALALHRSLTSGSRRQ